MDKLRSMEVFVSVVEAGNFSAAADKLDISGVMVGKHIHQLEKYLGTRLLQRSTRRQSLTEVGRGFYENCKKVLEQVRWAESSVESLQAKPQGLLRVSAPVTLGACVIAPLVANYLEEYPQVQVELSLSNSRVDLIEDGYDLAVRIGNLGEAELVAKSLPPYKMSISASPAYLKRKGIPTSPADLNQHNCLTHSIWSSRAGWPIDVAPTALTWPLQGRFSSNDGQALRAAALQGAGLLLQPEVLVAEDLAAGRLVSVLDQYVPPTRPVHLVYLPDFRPRPKLTSLVNHILQHLSNTRAAPGTRIGTIGAP